MKVFFIGAGPGDPELLTLKGRRILSGADLVVYAGSLVNPEILGMAPPGAEIHDSARMTLDEVAALYLREKGNPGTIARLHTGDPSLYGAIQEQMDICRREGIDFEVVPGVSSFSAAAAALQQELTLPGVSQTLIITRMAGRTPVPEREDLSLLARSRSTMILFLSVDKIGEAARKLLTSYTGDTPAAVVYRASWPDQEILRGTLADIPGRVRDAGIGRQALIFVGDALRAMDDPSVYEASRLYDPDFSHGYRP